MHYSSPFGLKEGYFPLQVSLVASGFSIIDYLISISRDRGDRIKSIT